MTFGSLFAGIGGMDLGLERAGMTCRWQVEIHPFCRRVLAKHWPDVPRHDDVRTFPNHGTREDWHVDLICGGFPCQDISHAGARAGIGGERSGLWSEFARVIRDLRPRFVLVENSAALLDRGMGVVLADLATLGFDAEWEVLPAAALGAPHLRERVFIVAHAQGSRLAADLLASSQGLCVRGAASGGGRHAQPERLGRGLGDHAYPPLLGDEGWTRAIQGGEEPPCVERGVRGATYGTPDGLDRTKALGNMVHPEVAEWIGRRIMEVANETPDGVPPGACRGRD